MLSPYRFGIVAASVSRIDTLAGEEDDGSANGQLSVRLHAGFVASLTIRIKIYPYNPLLTVQDKP